jgi:type IV pilus assembly protein PilE
MHRSVTTFAPRPRTQRGFTLLELMITAAIVAILAAVALPSYKQYLAKGKRAAAESAMLEIANRQQQYFLANRSYATTLSALNYSLPTEVSQYYVITEPIDTSHSMSTACASQSETIPTFIIAAVPRSTGSQASDGTLYITAAGVKCPSTKW